MEGFVNMDDPDKTTGIEKKGNIEIDLGESTGLTNSPTETLVRAFSTATDISNRFSETIRPIVESMTKIMIDTDYFSGFREAINSFTKAISEYYTSDFSAITENLRTFSIKLSELVKSIQIPEISDERKQELIESHQQWGEYGWTINPCADYETLFDTVPGDKKQADLAAMKYCNKKYMPLIFGEIRKCNRVKTSDFEEAVFAFDSSRYKSCALLLFSLIDAQLIRLQKKSDFDKNQHRRMVGAGAVAKAKTRAENDLSEGMLFTAMFYANLFACLFKMFEDGKDFKNQPQVINRNFLDHGMLTRRVSKKDCIQLFLLYYNMLCLLDMVY